MSERILYISGSIGLGHVWRDLEKAKEMHRLRPDIDITWMAEDPAVRVLRDRGENVLSDVDRMISTGQAAQETLNGYELNVVFSQTTPELMASQILGNIGTSPGYQSVPLDGAEKAARIIIEQLDGRSHA